MQLKQWEKEYRRSDAVIPTVHRARPSSALKTFEAYIADNELSFTGPVLDLGCGNGRNALHFAQKGYKVFALDFVQSVLDKITHKNIKTINHGLPKRLPFRGNSIGLVLDIISTASLNAAELKLMRREIRRVLRPGGFFLTYCLSDKNSYHSTLEAEKGRKFITMPSGITDKIWNPMELLSFYGNLVPQFVSVRHKKDRVGKWFGSLEMILGLFQK